MKEYRVKPENFNQVLKSILVRALTIIIVASGVLVPVLYYLHPRHGGDYANWAEFFNDWAVRFTFLSIAAITVVIAPFGLYSSKKLYSSLVITLEPDFVCWKSSNKGEKRIRFRDLIEESNSVGITIKSKSDKKIQLMIPKQVDDFDELRQAIAEKSRG